MNIFDLQATISLNGDAFINGVNQAQTAFGGLGSTVSAGAVALGNLASGAITKAADGIVGFGKDVVQTGKDFTAAMSNVKAISGANEEQFAALTAKAKEMGATTKFTATEAAEAFSYMAMAGWDAEQMISGIDGIMNLAAASGENLASVSDIVTDALTAFGLTAADSASFADVLAAASSSANTNVGMMGETFKYVAPVAGALGYSVADMATAIGTMANSGIKGSQAGTALRSALSRLVKPTDDVTKALGELGLSGGVLTTSDGNMLSFSETVGILRAAFSNLSEAEQAQYAATLFGQEAMSGMLAIINSSADEYNDLAETIGSASEAMGGIGTAAAMAQEQLDNLAGDTTLLESAFDGFKQSVYTYLEEPLRNLAQIGAGVFSDLTAAVNENGLSGAFAQLGSIIKDNVAPHLGGLAEKFAPLTTAFEGPLREGVEGAVESFGKIGDAVGKVGDSLAGFAAKFSGADFSGTMNRIAEAAGKLFDAFVNAKTQTIETVAESVSGFIDGLAQSSATDAIVELVQDVGNLFELFVSVSADVIEKIAAGTKKFLSGFDEFAVGEGFGEFVAAVSDLFRAITSVTADVISGVGEAVGVLAENADLEALGAGCSELIVFLEGLAANTTSAIASNIKGTGGALTEFGTRVAELGAKLGPSLGILVGHLASFLSKMSEMAAKLETVFAPIREFLGSTLLRLAGDALTVVVGMVNGIVEAIGEWVSAMEHGVNIVESLLTGDMHRAFNELLNSAVDTFESLSALFSGLIDPVRELAPKMLEAGKNMIQGFWNGMISVFDSAKNWVADKFGGLVTLVMDLFGEKSPSKVFAEIGANVVLGFREGWDDEFTGLERAVSRDMSSLTKTASISFDKSALGLASAAEISSRMLSADSSHGEPVEINLNLDGDTVARAVYDPLKDIAFVKGHGQEELAYA